MYANDINHPAVSNSIYFTIGDASNLSISQNGALG